MGRPKMMKEIKEEGKSKLQEGENTSMGKEASKCPQPPHLPRCQCQDTLGPGQAYFEDGQTGTVIIGDDTKGEVILKYMENGKEHVRKINKKR